MKLHFSQCHRCGQTCWNSERGLCAACAPRLDQQITRLRAAQLQRRGSPAQQDARPCGPSDSAQACDVLRRVPHPRPGDTMTGAYYRLTVAGGQAAGDGDGRVQVTDCALAIIPAAGDVLRVPMREVESVAAHGFCVLVTLADGMTIELSKLGARRAALLAQLRAAQAGASQLSCWPGQARRVEKPGAAARYGH